MEFFCKIFYTLIIFIMVTIPIACEHEWFWKYITKPILIGSLGFGIVIILIIIWIP
jgi:hypothetical protein